MSNNLELEDVTDKIVPDENYTFLNNEEAIELYDTCVYIMEEFIKNNPTAITEPEFDDIFDENIHELIKTHFDSDICYTDDAEEELEEIIEFAKADFFKFYMPRRSYPNTIILNDNPDYDRITQQLNILRLKPQPPQRTDEWYEFRHNLFTASNAYKAFESQSTRNQLIYEKCQPLNLASDDDVKEVVLVNTNTPLHWGQKYEPLSVKIYEDIYETKIEDFGCIQHDTYKFLGASPDGINVDINSKRYGRMLEIKNIVNREIDGIPKKEYWIQMQLQMAVCDLDECDFLETKFIEYPDVGAFNSDSNELDHEDEDGTAFTNVCLSKDGDIKGAIIYFHTKEGKPFYVYKPLDCIHPEDIERWEENTIEMYQGAKYGYTFMKFIYWKLEQMSCVLVTRNKEWFNANVGVLADLWATVEAERVTGYEHRAPNRRQKKEGVDATQLGVGIGVGIGKCFLHFEKIKVVKQDE
jgi:putative phage-type endonuclease